ncbi:unnamed protein product [Paramecium sonneborni]|uniref:Transmembrane protein n=1 Tax=Paramecium sonneborni TaxID=65129 RepID=A0A8S1P9R9_9CILI|nr:unnamed protein product [Paramecium sonneborni]
MFLKQLQILLIISSELVSKCQTIFEFNSLYQYKTTIFKSEFSSFASSECYTFGLWSKYNPLGNISQVGDVGVLESNCYHQLSAIEQTKDEINFLYYDCVDYQNKNIKKVVTFIGSNNIIYKFQANIDPNTYESIWYFFNLMIIPKKARVLFGILQFETVILQKEVEIEFPFKDVNLIIVFGGGLVVNNNQALYSLETSKLSFFPGEFYQLSPQFLDKYQYCSFQSIISNSLSLEIEEICFINIQQPQPTINVQELEINYYISQFQNINTFALQSWIRLTKINSFQEQIRYQLIKLCANFQNPQMINDNLSAFQLFYKLSKNQNQLIITTYSLIFPSVKLDLSNNPFLITKSFDINHNISLWHHLFVQKSETQILVKIIFYEEFQIYQYQFQSEIIQFQFVQFQLIYGNLLQCQNCLNVEMRKLEFFNCAEQFIPENNQCHNNCNQCDGPTKSDCLSYFLQKSTNHVFVHSTYDYEDQCYSFQLLKLNLKKNELEHKKCEFGYFEFDENCWRCPSKLLINLVTCIECLINPKDWINYAYCEKYYFSETIQSPFQLKNEIQEFYVFDGRDLKLCEECQNQGNIYQDYISTHTYFRNFCQQNNRKEQLEYCYKDIFVDCQIYEIQISGPVCIKCRGELILESNNCIRFFQSVIFNLICETPFYRTFHNTCKICPIKNCVYCFDYNRLDPSKSTMLVQSKIIIDSDEQFVVGCAQCKDGFRFDFTIGDCVYQNPSLQFCLRSYINLQGQETCTLSSVNDFNIAPSIIHCQQYIYNCEECYQTFQKTLKCIICEDGYIVSPINGLCSKTYQITNNIKKEYFCFFEQKEAWVQLTQAFSITFWYSNKMNSITDWGVNLCPLKCMDGYELFQNECIQFCHQNCQICQKVHKLQTNQFFICSLCSLNYYKYPHRTSDNRKCLICPSLCELCQQRSNVQIQEINQYFLISEENSIYTTQCLKSISQQNVKIDANLQIAQFCYDNFCDQIFEKQIEYNCDNPNIFSNYEQQFIEYSNQIGLQYFSFTVNLIRICENFYEIKNLLKEFIFSLQKTFLILKGNFPNILLTTEIHNFDEIEFNNLQIIVQIELNIIIQNRGTPLGFKIIDTLITSNEKSSIKSSIIANKFNNFSLQNVSIVNINLHNSNLYLICFEKNSNQLLFEFLKIKDCTLNNSIIFNLNQIQKDIIIKNVIIDSCELQNSSIFYFISDRNSNVTLFINQIIITDSIFIDSSLLQNYDSNIIMTELKIINSQFQNSQLIQFNQQITAFDFLLKYNQLNQTQLLNQISSNNLQIDLIQATQNTFQNFSFFSANYSQTQNQTYVSLKNLYFKENIHYEKIQKYLFILVSSFLKIQNVFITNTQNQKYFYLFNISKILIQNIVFENDFQQFKVPLSKDCLKNNEMHLQIIYVQGFQELQIENMLVHYQYTIDQSLIEILSNNLDTYYSTERIKIVNVTCFGNILIKLSLGNIFSIISIFSEKKQVIELQNIQFSENSFNQYSADPTKNSASLLFISSLYSSVILNKITSYQNVLTNSSYTFIKLYSDTILIKNIQVKYHNQIGVEFWNKYYDLFLESSLTQSQINYLIQESYTFQNQGGVMEINAQHFNLENGFFQFIIAESSQLFKIISQGQGIMILQNCYCQNSENKMFKNLNQNGAINLDSKSKIYNKFAPSIFSISPSPFKNKIIFKDFQVENCYSLSNSFFQLNFDSQNSDFNQVIIDNLIIIHNIEGLILFHQKLDYLDSRDLLKNNNDNAIIYIQGCDISIKRLQIKGLLILPLIKIVDCFKIFLTDFLIQDVQLFYPSSLIVIEQGRSIQSIIYIKNIFIQNIKKGIMKDYSLRYYLVPNITQIFEKCNSIKYINVKQSNQEYYNNTHLLEQLQQLNINEGSLIYLKSSSNNLKVYLKSLLIQDNNCEICQNGLIYLSLIDFEKILIKELSCINNIVKQFGCINAHSDQNLNAKIFTSYSNFILNQGTQGMALKSNNVKVLFSNTKILNNTANLTGGGIYLGLVSSEDFRIYQTFILFNTAKEGGGIYINGTSSLTKNNFNSSLLFLNTALESTNNIQEFPSHLDLSLNNIEMISQPTSEIKNNVIRMLKLKPYKILSQGKILQTNFLMIPSNQYISGYRIYDTKTQKYISYITELSILFKNQMNEQLRSFINSSCSIIQKTYDIMKVKELESNTISKIEFDSKTNTFDIGSQIFQFDPYQQHDKIYEIQAYCKVNNNEISFQYNLQVKSLFCELGEFYVSNDCQICQSSQGYYSVTYNSTQCSIFDKNKFEAITSNNILLKMGYWRPYYLSDRIEECFKNLEFCKGGWGVGNDLCAIGHIGGLCEQCDTNNVRGLGQYFQNEQGQKCLECNNLINNILPFILTSIWAFISNIITLNSILTTNKKFTCYQISQRFGQILFKLNLDQDSILLKLFFNYLWIFSLIFTFNINFTFSFSFVSRTSDTSYFMASNLDCQLIELFNSELIYSRVIAMFILMNFQIILIQIGFNIMSIISKKEVDQSIISVTILYLFVQNYSALIKQLFSIISKRQISNINYIQGDVSLFYGDGNHLQWIYYFAVPILMIVGLILPLTFLLVLYMKSHKINEIRFRKHIGYLFNEYTESNYFWEWIKLWKKTILTILLIYFETNVLLKGVFIAMTLQAYQFIAIQFQPYINQKLNKLDIQTGYFCSFAIFLALVLYIGDQGDNNFYSQIIQILILLLCIKLSFPFIFNIFEFYYKKYKFQFCNALLNLFKKQPFCKGVSQALSNILKSWKQQEDRTIHNIKRLRQSYKFRKTNQHLREIINLQSVFNNPLLNQIKL